MSVPEVFFIFWTRFLARFFDQVFGQVFCIRTDRRGGEKYSFAVLLGRRNTVLQDFSTVETKKRHELKNISVPEIFFN